MFKYQTGNMDTKTTVFLISQNQLNFQPGQNKKKYIELLRHVQTP